MKKLVFDFFYFTGLARIAWHTEEPSSAMQRAMDAGWLAPGARVLEVGCGLGTNCEWLAANGFDVTGIDLSSTGIRKAQKRLRKKNLAAKLYQRDFLQGLDEAPFDLVIDRATLHSFPAGDIRSNFASNLARMVKDDGSLLLIEMESGKERPNMPPFAMQAGDVDELFGDDFAFERIGEEIQQHKALGPLTFGQWRLTRAVAQEAAV